MLQRPTRPVLHWNAWAWFAPTTHGSSARPEFPYRDESGKFDGWRDSSTLRCPRRGKAVPENRGLAKSPRPRRPGLGARSAIMPRSAHPIRGGAGTPCPGVDRPCGSRLRHSPCKPTFLTRRGMSLAAAITKIGEGCLLYTSDAADDLLCVD